MCGGLALSESGRVEGKTAPTTHVMPLTSGPDSIGKNPDENPGKFPVKKLKQKNQEDWAN